MKRRCTTIPDVPVLFWSFRIMVALGFYFIALFAVAFYLSSKRRCGKPWFLRMVMYSLPLPWVAAELGWIVAEYGRQPWIIDATMPTFLGVSNIPASNVAASLAAFVLFYSALAIIDVALIVKYVRIGPQSDRVSSLRRARASRAGVGAEPIGKAKAMFDYMTLRLIWWALLGVLLVGFAVMDGFDHRRRHAASLRRAQRRAAARDAEHDRTGLGGQSGLVHSRRRRRLRRLAAALCGVLLRLLSRDAACPHRLHPAAGRHHLSRQEGSARLARDLGLAVLRFGICPCADLRRRLRQSSAGRSLSFRSDAARDL